MISWNENSEIPRPQDIHSISFKRKPPIADLKL